MKEQYLPRLSRFNPILAGSLLAFSLSSQAGPFNIQVNFGSGLTASQQAIFTNAENYWESVITGYQPGIAIASLTIDASGTSIDGVGGILGQAAPTFGISQGGFMLATQGFMEFDSADLASMESGGYLYDVILHEMAHVIGFGTLWTYNGVYTGGTGEYTGANALAAYNLEFDPSATFVPVELGGGIGTVDGHWNEVNGGTGNTGIVGLLPGETSFGTDFKHELMTGWLNPPTYVSCTTKASFIDIGYTAQTCLQASVPEPGTLALLSLGAAGMLFRMRRQNDARTV